MSTSVEDGDVTDQAKQQKTTDNTVESKRPVDTVVTVATTENATGSDAQSTEILEEGCTRSNDCLDLEAQDSRSKSNTGASDRSLPCPAEDTQLIRNNRFNKSDNMTSRSNRYNNKTVIIASLVFWGTVLIAIVVTVIVLTGRNIDKPVRHHTTPEPSTPAPMIGSTEAILFNTTNTTENIALFDSMVVDPEEKPS
ncbi:unnamed protein product [Oikopleura dioica]|uniref:CLLAC-motif containing domain-containing protein n=1 Tax=Oikopleura dioica TaxID=34765 RepID=E4XER1_OIKDI|nr:unnamed protein product [Oikopleura dioica]